MGLTHSGYWQKLCCGGKKVSLVSWYTKFESIVKVTIGRLIDLSNMTLTLERRPTEGHTTNFASMHD